MYCPIKFVIIRSPLEHLLSNAYRGVSPLCSPMVNPPRNNNRLYFVLFLPFPQERNVSRPVQMVKCYGGIYVGLVNQRKVCCWCQTRRKTLVQWVECLWSTNPPCQRSLWWVRNRARCCYATGKRRHPAIRSCVRSLSTMVPFMLCR